MTQDFSEHKNPDSIVSVRTTISQTDTMNRYYGDLCRNIDSAFILCGIEQESELCRGSIIKCPFQHIWCGHKICRLSAFMALVEKKD